ncbi:MAG TPA: cytochrome c biogenesis protein DipZ [Patescibacteria group bacterium]|nr:cytochrome c biogenesis protein DipZ [Patescibacteria group bacterium]
MIEILLSFVAGVLTILAPCIILPLPIIFGSSIGQSHKLRPVMIALGFTATFTLLTVFLFYLTQAFGFSDEHKRLIGVILLALFGLVLIFPSGFEKFAGRFTGLFTKASAIASGSGQGLWGGLVTGVIIGLVWAPCAGPLIAPVLALILQQKELDTAFLRMFAFALGAGIPMMLIAYGGQALTTKIKGLARYSSTLQAIFGGILIVLAASIYFQYDTVLQAKLVENFSLGSLEQKVNSYFDKQTAPSAPENTEIIPDTQTIPQMLNIKVPWIQPVPAPEFTGITNWLNLPEGKNTLTLGELRGKVILIDFWTYSCINCIRTLPYITKWYDTYGKDGFVVIGVHTPEFAFEKETDNVLTALNRHGIRYPVAQDNNFGTWNAYSNRYWPAHYLLDKEGNVVYTHFGEGKYEVTESAIQQLLQKPGPKVSVKTETTEAQTPEMYFGTARNAETFDNRGKVSETEYEAPRTDDWPAHNHFGVRGKWQFSSEKTTSLESGVIFLKFNAKKVFMVAASKKPQVIKVHFQNTGAVREVTVSASQLYELLSLPERERGMIWIEIPKAGFEAYTFTFG